MKRNLLRALSMVFVLLTISCSKDGGGGGTTPTPTVNKSDLLTKPIWKLTALTVDPATPVTQGGVAVSNWYAQFGTCSKDDIYKFNVAGTYAFEEGATKCSPNHPTVWESGTWKFNTTSNVILMSETGASDYEYKISDLTATKLLLVREVKNNSSGIIFTFTYTYAPN